MADENWKNGNYELENKSPAKDCLLQEWQPT